MSEVIGTIGDYVTTSGLKATVNYVDEKYAFGYVEAREWPYTWFMRTGAAVHANIDHAITGPFVQPRKRVEGWVNVYPSTLSDMIHQTEAGARRCAGKDALRLAVFVREIDPQAEKEAREILESIKEMAFEGTALCKDATRALALLFPEGETG